MPILNLDKVFHPGRIAVIGASRLSASVGSTVLQNLIDGGFEGEIYPVNPKYKTIGTTTCFANVGELPNTADLAVICTPAPTVPGIVSECGQAGIPGLVIVSAGFRETGDDGEQLEGEIEKQAKKFPGIRIVGPNCLGVMAPHVGLNASFAADMPPKESVAFISQSGALCTSVLDWALQENVGFSHFVSVGNMLDVGIADLIDYFAMDKWTDSIILYVESITESRQFMSAARAFAKNKPIIAYKAGRFAESAQAAASHTGAMAGVDAVYEAAFARAGVVRVFEVDDLFDCAELLARQKRPYPEEFSKRTRLKDRTPVLLRPIKPEDEPMWHALLGSCSPESIRFRFRYMFKGTTHEMATRFCFIDYDREIAIVAEIDDDDERKLIGVGRLVADADHHEAEYAILVGDPWQGLGLGSLLTDYCLDVCQRWGVQRVVAETAPDNRRMLDIFRKRDFTTDASTCSDTVFVAKELCGSAQR